MKSALAVLLASTALAGCAVVPVAPPFAYGPPRVAFVAPRVAFVAPRVVVPAPVVVVTPGYRRGWWHR